VFGKLGARCPVGLAVLHAGDVDDVGLALQVPQAMVAPHAVAVRKQLLRLGDVAVGEHEVRRHEVAEVEDVRHDGVDLLRGERLRRIPRHRAVDVVPERRDRGQLHEGRARHVTGDE
jgi:hypothetical protein